MFASFASVFLLKVRLLPIIGSTRTNLLLTAHLYDCYQLLRPRFSSVLTPHQKDDIINLVQRLIDVLKSDEVAIDERHTPKLYAKFLTKLLDRQVSSQRSPRSSVQPSDSSHPSPSRSLGTPPTVPTAPTMVNNKFEPGSYMGYPGPGTAGVAGGAPPPTTLPTAAMTGEALNASQTAGVGGFFSSDFTMRVPVNVGAGPDILMDMSLNGVNTRSNGDMLAAMRAVENPAFWYVFHHPFSNIVQS